MVDVSLGDEDVSMTTTQPTVIAGVDGSKHSADALVLARTLAPPLGATALACHVQAVGDQSVPIDERITTLVVDRSSARGLERAAERQHSLLIALGASSRSRIGRVFPGGTAERLVSTSSRPVAIAPSGYSENTAPMEVIGCAYDGSPEARAALTWTTMFARNARCSVRLLTVDEPSASVIPAYHGVPAIAVDDSIQRHLSRHLAAAAHDVRREGVEVESWMLEGSPEAVLESESTALDMIVTGSRPRGPARATLLGSVSRHLVRKASCPVLVVPRGYQAGQAGLAQEAS
jgi:nucleotide-binding universal stress UspA family protein